MPQQVNSYHSRAPPKLASPWWTPSPSPSPSSLQLHRTVELALKAVVPALILWESLLPRSTKDCRKGLSWVGQDRVRLEWQCWDRREFPHKKSACYSMTACVTLLAQAVQSPFSTALHPPLALKLFAGEHRGSAHVATHLHRAGGKKVPLLSFFNMEHYSSAYQFVFELSPLAVGTV